MYNKWCLAGTDVERKRTKCHGISKTLCQTRLHKCAIQKHWWIQLLWCNFSKKAILTLYLFPIWFSDSRRSLFLLCCCYVVNNNILGHTVLILDHTVSSVLLFLFSWDSLSNYLLTIFYIIAVFSELIPSIFSTTQYQLYYSR